MKSKNILFLSIFFWATLTATSFLHNYSGLKDEKRDATLLSAKKYSEFVILTRTWASLQNGIYVPITKQTPPNPYLSHLKNRDIVTQDGAELTLINPAYMTRLMSEVASAQQGIQFHLTSLTPINPINTANTFEQKALRILKNSPESTDDFYRIQNGQINYFAPLKVEESCLTCHATQGYRVGDICGGISINVPYDEVVPFLPTAITHILIFIAGLLGILTAFSKLRKAYETIEFQATMDDTTGIANRRSFSDHFHREFTNNQRRKSCIALIMCDIDHFKAYNDSYGHREGDNCLYSIAQTIASVPARPCDFTARYGGEEFVIILPNTSLKGAQTVAEKIRKEIIALQIPHKSSLVADHVTVSFGVAVCVDQELLCQDQLLINADTALYEAKNTGRNRVQVFTKNLQA